MNDEIKLFVDWKQSQSDKKINIITNLLEQATKLSSNFDTIISEMGSDGKTLKNLLIKEYGNLTPKIKKEIAGQLLEAKDGTIETNVGTYYYPIADRSNALVSEIDPNDRDIVIQIRHAITGGNYSIAEELMKNSWSSLTIKDRLGIIEWIQNMDFYNRDSGVPKSSHTRLKKLTKQTEDRSITKDEFITLVIKTSKEKLKAK